MALLLLLSTTLANEDMAEQMRLAREQAKPWLMKSVVVAGGIDLYFSPATMIVGVLISVNLYYIFFHGRNATCRAHHILMKDTKANHQMLVSMKEDIGTSLTKFGDYAAKYSTCPSGKANKGDLGTFPRGAMVAPFDAVCFDPASPIQTVLGPVRTPFGWHLIYIKQRKL